MFIVMPAICGLQARFTISEGPVYAITGSLSTRFFASGRGDALSPVAECLGLAAGMFVSADRSQSSSWESSEAVASSGVSEKPQESAFTGARCARSSITGCPGLRMSRIWMSFPSWWKVAI